MMICFPMREIQNLRVCFSLKCTQSIVLVVKENVTFSHLFCSQTRFELDKTMACLAAFTH